MGRVRGLDVEHLAAAELAAAELLPVVVVDHQLRAEEHARGDEQHRQDDQKPNDRQVSGPIKPSTERSCDACHDRVAASVFGP